MLDTCVLKLVTLRNQPNRAADIFALAVAGAVECWMSAAMFEEYSVVLADRPDMLADVHQHFQLCYPLQTLDLIRHEPDNRFIECALAVEADYLVTVNTAHGHFDQRAYGTTRVVTPGAFVALPVVQKWYSRP